MKMVTKTKMPPALLLGLVGLVGLLACTEGGLLDERHVVEVTINRVEPNAGPTTGGTAVTLVGDNLRADATLAFDGAPVEFELIGPSTLLFTTPPHLPGPASLTVTLPDGRKGSCADCFRYEEPKIELLDVMPLRGPTSGNTRLTLMGSFFEGLSVFIDGQQVELVEANDEVLVVLTPPHVRGRVLVEVRSDQDAENNAQAAFHYFDTPAHFTDREQLGDSPLDLWPGDFNGDGWDDIVVQEWSQGAINLSLRRSDGRGFAGGEPISISPAHEQLHQLEVCDVDLDGDLDLVLLSRGGTSGLQLLLNPGDGNFQPAAYTQIEIGRVLCGEFDGDGQGDLVLYEVDSLERLATLTLLSLGPQGQLSGQRQLIEPVSTEGALSALASGDIDGDGISDVAFTTTDTLHLITQIASSTVTHAMLEGPPSFQLFSQLHIIPQSSGPADIAGVSDHLYLYRWSLAEQRHQLTIETVVPESGLSRLPVRYASVDSLVGASLVEVGDLPPAPFSGLYSLEVFRPQWPVNRSQMRFYYTERILSLTVLDVEGDGTIEVLVANNRGSLELLHGRALGVSGGLPIEAPRFPDIFSLLDPDGDGFDDVFGFRDRTLISLRSGAQTEGWVEGASLAIPEELEAGHGHGELIDLDGDNRPEIFFRMANIGLPGAWMIVHLEQNGALRLGAWGPGTGRYVGGFCDFDLDGDQDLLIEREVLQNDGRGGFTPSFEFPPPIIRGEPYPTLPLAPLDVDEDGMCELVSFTPFGLRIFRIADQTLELIVESSYPTGAAHWVQSIKDLNQDGRPDLIVISEEGDVYSYLGQEDATFGMSSVVTRTAPYAPVHMGDFDGDTLEDIAVFSDDGFLQLFFGLGTGTFDLGRKLKMGASVPFCSVTDYNGDGLDDLLLYELPVREPPAVLLNETE